MPAVVLEFPPQTTTRMFRDLAMAVQAIRRLDTNNTLRQVPRSLQRSQLGFC
jgi:hypothetical protein